MRVYKSFFLIFLYILCLSCSSDRDKNLIFYENLLPNYGIGLFQYRDSLNNQHFYDTFQNGNTGSYYIFNKLGYLKNYYFFSNKNICEYAEFYNDNGMLDSTKKNIFLLKYIEKDSNVNTIKLYICTLNKIFKDLKITLNHNKTFNVKLETDNTFSNTMIAVYKANSDSFNSEALRADYKLEYKDIYTGVKKIAYDSLILYKVRY